MSPPAEFVTHFFTARTSRYEALIRVAKAIRSRRNESELFQPPLSQLRIARRGWMRHPMSARRHGQLVEWHFAELYYDQMEARRLQRLFSKETAVWWSTRTNSRSWSASP